LGADFQKSLAGGKPFAKLQTFCNTGQAIAFGSAGRPWPPGWWE
jgi:hypothetical protein